MIFDFSSMAVSSAPCWTLLLHEVPFQTSFLLILLHHPLFLAGSILELTFCGFGQRVLILLLALHSEAPLLPGSPVAPPIDRVLLIFFVFYRQERRRQQW